eukprot:2737943-Pyramimonas_sp.AAC.1
MRPGAVRGTGAGAPAGRGQNNRNNRNVVTRSQYAERAGGVVRTGRAGSAAYSGVRRRVGNEQRQMDAARWPVVASFKDKSSTEEMPYGVSGRNRTVIDRSPTFNTSINETYVERSTRS